MSAAVRLARTAGLYYLLVGVFGGFAETVRHSVYVSDDAVATTTNLEHVDRSMARAMVVFVVLQVAITCAGIVHQLAALLVATGPAYAGIFGTRGSNAMVLLLMEMRHSGQLVVQIFFGLWLFPLGWLAYRSAMFPRPPGVLLLVATGAHLVDVPLHFLAHDLAATISPIVVVPPRSLPPDSFPVPSRSPKRGGTPCRPSLHRAPVP
jgi:Domain of unknown function (DUF4386)